MPVSVGFCNRRGVLVWAIGAAGTMQAGRDKGLFKVRQVVCGKTKNLREGRLFVFFNKPVG
jgi:hypothetical protein